MAAARSLCLALLSLVCVAPTAAQPGNQGLTPCQRCCAPGGDCSKAFKGAPGTCCGVLNGLAYCCPSYASFENSGGKMSGGAKCHHCADAYRCSAAYGASTRSVCGVLSSRRPFHPTGQPYESGATNLALLLVAIGGVMGVLYCARRPVEGHYAPPVVYDQHGKPVGMPACGVPAYGPGYGYGGGCGCGPYGGYGGMGVAGGAATGFVGGMLVSEMMHSSHHHDYGGDYGGGYGGGFGGDFGGGGDAGFAADM